MQKYLIDRIYDFEKFLSLINERKLNLKDLRLCFWKTVRYYGIIGKIEAILSIPDKVEQLGTIVRECVLGECYYDDFLYREERKRNEEGEETKRIKKWGEKIFSFLKEKLGFIPVEGRWTLISGEMKCKYK